MVGAGVGAAVSAADYDADGKASHRGIVSKDLLDRHLEKSGDFERQWQTGIVLAGFDRMNGLP